MRCLTDLDYSNNNQNRRVAELDSKLTISQAMDDYLSDALLVEVLDDFEATAMPYLPTCFISSGFCPTGPLVSTSNSTASPFLLPSSSASAPPSIRASPSTQLGIQHQNDQEIQQARQCTIPQKKHTRWYEVLLQTLSRLEHDTTWNNSNRQ